MTNQHWPSIRIDNWYMYSSRVGQLTQAKQQLTYVFRGQSDAAWGLRPSFTRLLPPGTSSDVALSYERAALLEFGGRAHLMLGNSIPLFYRDHTAFLDWWPLMQHYGAPTRLLDWTASPYIAAYFAAEQSSSQDGAVYGVHIDSVQRAFGDPSAVTNHQLMDSNASNRVFFVDPHTKTQRAAIHQARFSVSLSSVGEHEVPLVEACSTASGRQPNETFLFKWVIAADAKQDILRHLRLMNVTAEALFPGLDGLGRSIGEQIRLKIWTDAA